MRLKRFKRKITNILLLGILLAIIVGIYYNIKNSKAENIIELTAVALDNYGYLENEEFQLEAQVLDDNTYQIELPDNVNGKKISEISSVTLIEAEQDGQTAESEQNVDELIQTEEQIVETEEATGTTEIQTEITPEETLTEQEQNVENTKQNPEIDIRDNQIIISKEQLENKKIKFEITYDIMLLEKTEEGELQKDLLSAKTEEERNALEITEETEMLYSKVLKYEDEEKGKMVEVKGFLPIDAKLQVEEVSQEKLTEIFGEAKIDVAYDIKIIMEISKLVPVDEENPESELTEVIEIKEINPEDFEEKCEVSIKDANILENSQVYHVKEDNTYEKVNVKENLEESISFEAQTFSVYAVSADESIMTTATDTAVSDSNYGMSVNYTPANGSSVGWKLFHIDDEGIIYLIADDFVEKDYIPKGKGGTAVVGTTNSTYYQRTFQLTPYSNYAGWSDIPSNIASKWLSQYAASTYTSLSQYDNMKATAYLLDTNVWSGFKDANGLAEYAIGGPTLEMFVESYNETHPSAKIDLSVTSQMGYSIKWNSGGSYSNYITSTDSYNGLYLITTDPSGYKASAYWLASPMDSYQVSMGNAWYNGRVVASELSHDKTAARPVIALKKGCTINSNGEIELPDTTPPTGTMTASATVTNQSTVTIYVTPSDTGGSGVSSSLTIAAIYWNDSEGGYRSSKAATWDSANNRFYATFTFDEIKNRYSGETNNGDGVYYFDAFVYDKAGNRTLISTTVTYDTTPPTGTMTASKTVTNEQNVTIYVTPSDAGGSGASSSLSINGIYWNDSEGGYRSSKAATWDSTNNRFYATFTFDEIKNRYSGETNNGDGVYHFDSWVVDKAGNKTLISTRVRYDATAPTITVNPTLTEATTTVDITITAAEVGTSGFSETNEYEYQLGTSNTQVPSEEWTTYESGKPITLGGELSGEYYLWIKSISDKAGNTSTSNGTTVETYHVFGPYILDNKEPITVTFTPEENTIYSKSQSTVVTVTGDNLDENSLKYQWTTSTTQPDEGTFTSTFTNGETIKKSKGTGIYYLWILAKDTSGNTTITSSSAFYFDNAEPMISINGQVQNKITASNLTEDDYGGYITNYTAPNGADVNWRIFHSDRQNIYLIADDYVNIKYIPTGKGGTAVNPGNISGTFGINAADDYAGFEDIENGLATKLLSQYVKAGYTSTSGAMKAVAYLMDTNQWSGFTNNKYADYSIGAPTIELFAESYNKLNKDKTIDIQAASDLGYQIKWSSDTNYGYSIEGINSSDSLYLISNKNKAYGIWIATILLENAIYGNFSSIMSIMSDGKVGASAYSNPSVFGSRPIVSLKSNVQIEKQVDGTYLIVEESADEIIENKTWQKTHSVEVEIKDELNGLTEGTTLQYAWSESNTQQPTEWENAVISNYTAGVGATATTTISGSGLTGKYYLWIKPVTVKDLVDNSNKRIITTGEFWFDNTAPSIEINPQENEIWSKSQTVKVSIGDALESGLTESIQLQYGWSTSNVTEPINWETKEITATSEIVTIDLTLSDKSGKYYLWVKPLELKDVVGNSQTETIISTGTFWVDNTAPATPTITTSSNGEWTNQDIQIKVSSSDNVSGNQESGIVKFEYSYDNSSWNVWDGNSITTENDISSITKLYTEEVNTTLYIRAVDEIGNVSEVSSTTLQIDKSNPTITVNPTLTEATTTVDIAITVGDIGGSGFSTSNEYKYQLGTSEVVAPTGAWSTYESGTPVTIGTNLNGEYYLWVKAISDKAGNTSASNGTTVDTYHVYGPYIFDNIEQAVIITGEATGVTDGLIRHYDGTNNLGNGHSNETNTWTDLSGNEDAEINVQSVVNDNYVSLENKDSYISIGKIENVDDITLETSIMIHEQQSGIVMIISDDRMRITLNEGKLNFTVDGVATIYLEEELETGKIYNISGTYDGVSIKLYVDGILHAEKGASGTISEPTIEMVVGAICEENDVPTNKSYINVYSTRIYNRALSQSEIQQNLNADRVNVEAANNEEVTLSFIFAEDVEGFDLDDITVTNGTKGTLTKISNSEYTLEVTGIVAEKNLTVSIAEGSYTDKNGNIGSAASITRYRDTIGPGVTITKNSGDITTESQITYNVKFDESTLGFNKDDITITNGTIESITRVNSSEYNVVVKNTQTANQTLTIRENAVFDIAGNGNKTIREETLIDIIPPAITIEPQENTTWSKDHTVTVTITDEGSGLAQGATITCYWSDDNGSVSSTSEPKAVTITGYSEGDRTATIELSTGGESLTGKSKFIVQDLILNDIAGNSATLTEVETEGYFYLDNEAPEAPTITNSSGGKWTNQDIQIDVSSNDSVSGTEESGIVRFEYSYDNSTWYGDEEDWDGNTITTQNNKSSISKTWTDEINTTLYVRAIDAVGNVSQVSSTLLQIDKSLPTVTANPEVTTNANTNDYVKTQNVTLTVAELGVGLNENNEYQYCLVLDKDLDAIFDETDLEQAQTADETKWKTYESGTSIEIGENKLTGTYYLIVKTICDKAGNESVNSTTTIGQANYHQFGPYKFDNTSPTITVNPDTNITNGENENAVREMYVTLTYKEPLFGSETTSAGISDSNTYEYYLSTSNTELVGGTLTTVEPLPSGDAYTKTSEINIGAGETGQRYLFVRTIIDNLNNESETTVTSNGANYQMIGTYIFDNTAPSVKFEPNGNLTWAQTHSTKVTVTDADANTFKYLWVQGNTQFENGDEFNTAYDAETVGDYKGTFSNEGIITSPEGVTGDDWYLWIYTEDTSGNTIVIRTTNPFKIDNTLPNISVTPELAEVCKSTSITIIAADLASGLNSSNEYKAYLSTSKDDLVNQVEIGYTSGTTIKNVGAGITGWRYLFVRTVKDSAELESTQSGTIVTASDGNKYHRYGPYIFDNTAPEVQFNPDGNGSWKTEQTTTVTVDEKPFATGKNQTASNITPSNYGGYVTNYTPANGSNVGWRIFHSDGENIYLIADDYIELQYVPAGKNGSTVRTDTNSYPRGFSVASIYTDYTGLTDISTDISTKWLKQYVAEGYTGTYVNMRTTAYLLDTNQWSGFANTKYAEYAIGAPTLELFVASYNATHEKDIDTQVSSDIGYQVKWITDTAYNNSISGLDSSESLYIISDTTNAEAMYVASPSAYQDKAQIGVLYLGMLARGGISLMSGASRPIVALKSDCILQRQDDGTYLIIDDTVDEKEAVIKSGEAGVNKQTLRYVWRKASEGIPTAEQITENLIVNDVTIETLETIDDFKNGVIKTQIITADTVDELTSKTLQIKTPITKDTDSGDDWVLWVYAEDKLGNANIVSSKEFWLDNTVPIVESMISTPSSGTTYTLTISGISDTNGTQPQSEVKGYYISTDATQPTVDGTNWISMPNSSITSTDKTTGMNTYTITYKGATEHTTYYFWTIDNVGNISKVNKLTTKEIFYSINNTSWYETFADAVSAAASPGDTIYVLKDITDSSDGTVNKSVKLDTNGKTLTRTTPIEIATDASLELIGTGTIYGNIYAGNGTVYLSGGTVNGNVHGGKIEGTASNSNIILQGATVNGNIYGGGDGTEKVESVDIELVSGTVSGVYGGGLNNSEVGTVNIVLNGDVTIESGNIFGGPNTLGTVDKSNIYIMDGTINNVYGGGSQGGITLNTTVTIDAGATITGNVYGGAHKATVGNIANNSGNTTINIAGGTIEGNIYGGSDTDPVYGQTTINIGKDAVGDLDDIELTTGKITIGGNIYGGGHQDKTTEEEEIIDFTEVSVKNGTQINVDGNETTINFEGDIFGSGERTTYEGDSSITIKNLGESGSPNLISSIQRTGTLTIDNSYLEIIGISDQANLNIDASYTLNRIGELNIQNGTYLYLRRGFNVVEGLNSLAADGSKATVTITEGAITSQNVDNRIYVYEGVNLFIAKQEYSKNVAISEYGKVNGMTFFGMYTRDRSNNSLKYDIYDPTNPTSNDMFAINSYVEGKYDSTQAITVDGFYTNAVKDETSENRTIITKYVTVITSEPLYQDWMLGDEEIYTQEVTLVAQRNKEQVYQSVLLENLKQQGAEYQVKLFAVNSLEPDINLVNKTEVKRVALSENTANTTFALTMKNGSGWQNSGETHFYTTGTPIQGTTTYLSDYSGNAPYIDLFLYNSINITETKDCGYASIVFEVTKTTNGDASEGSKFKIALLVNIQTIGEGSEGEFQTDASITAGINFGLITENEIFITDRSSMTTYFNMYPLGVYDDTEYRVLSSTCALPVGTGLTMVDYGEDENYPKVYYYEVEEGDGIYEENTGRYIYNFSDFILMSSLTEGDNVTAEEAAAAHFQNNNLAYSTSGIEEYKILIDFKNAKIENDLLEQNIRFELRDSSGLIKNNEILPIQFNIYADDRSELSLNVTKDTGNVYNIIENGELNFTVKSIMTTQSVSIKTTYIEEDGTEKTKTIVHPIEDTYFDDKKLGMAISLYDSQGNKVPYEKVKGIYYVVDGQEYYPDLTGTTRWYLADNVVTVDKNVEMHIEGGLLDSGTYQVRIENFASDNGTYFGQEGDNKENTTITIIDLDYGLKVEVADTDRVIDALTGNTHAGTPKMNIAIKASDVVDNTNIRVSLYKRDITYNNDLTYAGVSYTLVDLANYVSNILEKPESKSLTSRNSYEYIVTNTVEEQTLIELILNLKSSLLTGGYKIQFSLYSGDNCIGTVDRHFVVTE